MSVDVGGSASTKSEPNVVPLCDILLVLLIIFMVIMPVSQKGIDIQLPETQSPTEGQTQSKSGIVLTLERDLTLKLNQEPIGLDMLEDKLRSTYQTRSDKTIFIRADKTLLYKDVLKIIDIAKGSGIEVLGVMTQTYETETQ